MKHLTPISKASAEKQVPWLETLTVIVNILATVIPLISTVLAKEASR